MAKHCPKHEYQILFKDSPEYFLIHNARMVQEGAFVRFMLFDGDIWKEDHFYPIANIHRIKMLS